MEIRVGSVTALNLAVLEDIVWRVVQPVVEVAVWDRLARGCPLHERRNVARDDLLLRSASHV